jgi:demethylmenaquinone methyltransferase/2-methoxy-6-polyprenyl-1,4-benzoquinol methylase
VRRKREVLSGLQPLGEESNQGMDEIKTYYKVVERAFEKLAPYYDAICVPISGVREQVADLLASREGSRILDVATGTGTQAFAFAKRGHDVVGIDLSEAMIRVAQDKNRDGKVSFEVADATHLAYPNDSFDVSSTSFALHDMPLAIREKVLMEMVRVTKPGGTILIVDYGLPKNRLGRWLIYHLVALYEATYYTEFIQSDLRGLLRRVGMEVDWERPVILGAVRILKGRSVTTTELEAFDEYCDDFDGIAYTAPIAEARTLDP